MVVTITELHSSQAMLFMCVLLMLQKDKGTDSTIVITILHPKEVNDTSMLTDGSSTLQALAKNPFQERAKLMQKQKYNTSEAVKGK